MPFDPVFWMCSIVGVVSAMLMVTRKNPVYSAVSLLVSFLSFAVVFLKLQAPFLAAIHVLVYTGAILVLFVFVIMLLNLEEKELGDEYPVNVRLACAGLCTGMFVLLAVPILSDPALRELPVVADPKFGGVESIGTLLFTTYALPFELVSVLIIVAMFGAMVLAKKKLWA